MKYVLKKVIPVVINIIIFSIVSYLILSSMHNTLSIMNYKIDKVLCLLCIGTIMCVLSGIVYHIYKMADVFVNCYIYLKEVKENNTKFLGDITIWRSSYETKNKHQMYI